MTARDVRIGRWLKRNGWRYPYRLVRAARRAGITVPTALALVSKETGDGRNIYGHDPVDTGGCYRKGGPVTRRNYACYKAHRRRTNAMQGVGPVQLTYYTYQDQADRAGGCWHPYYNMLTGFRILRGHWERNGHDLEAAYAQYNGSGPAARAYGRDAVRRRRSYQARLRRAGLG